MESHLLTSRKFFLVTLVTGQVEISAQNHNFAIDPATLPAGVEISHINLNDGTCAGMTYPAMKVPYPATDTMPTHPPTHTPTHCQHL